MKGNSNLIKLFGLAFVFGLVFLAGCISHTQETSTQTTTSDVDGMMEHDSDKMESDKIDSEDVDGMEEHMEEMDDHMDEMEMHMEKTFTLEQIAEHNSREDCWMAIHGKVYDPTDYVSNHPGGDAILAGCGKDATDMFETKPTGNTHSEGARNQLDNYYIGELAQ